MNDGEERRAEAARGADVAESMYACLESCLQRESSALVSLCPLAPAIDQLLNRILLPRYGYVSLPAYSCLFTYTPALSFHLFSRRLHPSSMRTAT